MSSNRTDVFEEQYCEESETETDVSDDSEDDPTFEVVEETRLTLSNLSINGRTKSSTVKGKKEEGNKCSVTDLVVSELDEKGKKTYETVQRSVEAGLVEKLKTEECKIYLRKHGLRLSGTKETLIQRIKEHIDIVNCGGEKKYLESTFVVNCKGDACMGDIVMFEQDVYEMYNIASRSASGPPCGRRTVAGRIVKESYGTAKQQHTFTIEVLWSKGEKPLPPLHPMLIKGRNLYRLKTLRQRWDDEGERRKILSEKHDRGGVARLSREARLQQKEMRKLHNQTRDARNEHQNRKQKDIILPDPINAIKQQIPHNYLNTCIPIHQEDLMHTCIPIHQKDLMQRPFGPSRVQVVPPRGNPERQPLKSMNYTFPGDQHINPLQQLNNFDSTWRSIRGGIHHEPPMSYPLSRFVDPTYSQQSHAHHYLPSMNAATNPPPVQHLVHKKAQACRHYFTKGRCYYGDQCKFSHDLAENKM